MAFDPKTFIGALGGNISRQQSMLCKIMDGLYNLPEEKQYPLHKIMQVVPKRLTYVAKWIADGSIELYRPFVSG